MKEDNEHFSFEENEMEIRLWEYIDGLQTAEEKSMVEQLIQKQAAWQAKYHELLQINQLLNESELEQPSMRFAKNVMEEISQLHITPATKAYINNKIIWSIGAFFIITIVTLLVYGINQSIATPSNESTPMSSKLNEVDFSSIFSDNVINTFLIVNIVLALMLLDRFLSAKRKNYTHSTL